MTSADTWADIMRWWAVMGGALALFPLGGHLRYIAASYVTDSAQHLSAPMMVALFTTIGLLCFILFAIGAGAVIPFTSRIDGLTLAHPIFKVWMAGAWSLSGIGAWATAIAYARNRYLAGAASVSWFVAVSFAVLATAGA